MNTRVERIGIVKKALAMILRRQSDEAISGQLNLSLDNIWGLRAALRQDDGGYKPDAAEKTA
jgi:hypothetical protein